MTRSLALIQARMSSSRLPGKVLKPLLGLPSIVFMVHRVRKATRIDRVVVATSTDQSDDPLVEVLDQHSIRSFRGSLDDVLDRFYKAAVMFSAETIVRLTGDCPLVDADLIDRVACAVQDRTGDYASNIEPPTYPNGLDVEAFSFAALAQAWREATLSSEREHVTPFLRKQPDRFRQINITATGDLSMLRWTIDYPDDYQYVQSLVAAVGARAPADFDRFDLYRALERNPSLHRTPLHQRNEGYLRSLTNDRPRNSD